MIKEPRALFIDVARDGKRSRLSVFSSVQFAIGWPTVGQCSPCEPKLKMLTEETARETVIWGDPPTISHCQFLWLSPCCCLTS